MLKLSNFIQRMLFIWLKIRIFLFKLKIKNKDRGRLSDQTIGLLVDNEPVDSFSFQTLAKEVQQVLLKNSIRSKIIFVDNNFLKNLNKHDITMVFIGFSRVFQKEGTLQALLEHNNIPYTGSDFSSTAVCLNKAMSKRIVSSEGFKTPEFIELSSLEELNIKLIKKKIGFPLIVKPVHGTISLDVHLVNSVKELNSVVKKCFEMDDSVLIEEYINGEEISMGVLGNKGCAESLGILSVDRKDILDFTDKKIGKPTVFQNGSMSRFMKNKLGEEALKIFKILNCQVFARMDFIIKGKKLYFLEINSIPGLFKQSFMTKSAKAAGIDRDELILRILELSLKK